MELDPAGAELDAMEEGLGWIGAEGEAGADELCPAGTDETGQIVVLMATTEVTSLVERAGQFVTSGAQLVTV